MFLTRQQVREFDRRAIEDFGVPALVLMENAGRGAADVMVRVGARGTAVICCGKGNNGGDGLVMARHLENRGLRVLIHLFARPEDLSPEAAVHWNIVAKAHMPTQIWTDIDDHALAAALAQADWIVDALYGTGLQGPVRSPMDRVIAAINNAGKQVLAVDIPSGLDADTGTPLGTAVRARHTATFVAVKKGFANSAALAWLGEVHVVDIGAPRQLQIEAGLYQGNAPR